MTIDSNVLFTYGACSKRVRKNEYIFLEGDIPCNYYQLIQGRIKMVCTNEEGVELIQHIFDTQDSFGEPPLLAGLPYPSAAIALQDCIIMRLPYDRFQMLLRDLPEYANKLIEELSRRVYQKTLASQTMSYSNPELRLLHFLKMYKRTKNLQHKVCIPFTRQEIADSVGLRVETVIRTLRRLSLERKCEIKDRKLYF